MAELSKSSTFFSQSLFFNIKRNFQKIHNYLILLNDCSWILIDINFLNIKYKSKLSLFRKESIRH